MEWITTPISKNFDRNSFDCGVLEQNDYLKKHARRNHDKGFAKTFVALQMNSIIGYYSISMSQVLFEELPEVLRKGLPRYPAPAALIGQFGVDLNHQGQGLGERLLYDAIGRLVCLSDEIGIFAIKVDANSQKSRDFYLKRGFQLCERLNEESKNATDDANPKELFPLLLPMSVVMKTRPQKPIA